jgi:glutamate formiminotransferase
VALDRIDLRTHTGVHPRIGALDVLPFVPLSGVEIEDCAALAVKVGGLIWEYLRVPVYLYEAAARRSEFRDLARVRHAVTHGAWPPPDIGDLPLHPAGGAVAVGARKFLIAFNVNLESADVAVAKRIARAVRASSGGLTHVKALGWLLASRGIAQVSMNLTDFAATPIHVAFDAVCREAAAAGVGISETEFVGLIPRRAFELSAGRVPGLERSLILEDRL